MGFADRYGSHRPRCSAGRHAARDQDRVGRDADQPTVDRRRHLGDRRDRARRRRPSRRRQHVCHPVSPAAAEPRRRRRRALDHQVLRRSLRRGRRFPRHQRHRAVRSTGLSAERHRRRGITLRQLPHAAGLKTLAVRMDRHCENARAVVELLQGHDKVTHVLYPGLSDHPGHDAAARQMKDFGGMVSFRVAGGADAAMRLTTTTQVFSLAESLGAVESLIEHPGVMTHVRRRVRTRGASRSGPAQHRDRVDPGHSRRSRSGTRSALSLDRLLNASSYIPHILGRWSGCDAVQLDSRTGRLPGSPGNVGSCARRTRCARVARCCCDDRATRRSGVGRSRRRSLGVG